MVWNHRILFHREKPVRDSYYAVHECFYDKPGDAVPHSWTEQPIRILENTMPELEKSLSRMLTACAKPLLEIKGSKLIPHRRAAVGKSGE